MIAVNRTCNYCGGVNVPVETTPIPDDAQCEHCLQRALKLLPPAGARVPLTDAERELGAFFDVVGCLVEVYGVDECRKRFAQLGTRSDDQYQRMTAILDEPRREPTKP